MTTQELIALCEKFQKEDTETFFAIVSAFVNLHPDHMIQIASSFECATSTVYKWINKFCSPHPRVRAEIVDFIERRTRRALIEAQAASNFIALCDNFKDGDKEEFQKIIIEFIKLEPGNHAYALRDLFKVSLGTIDRWARGRTVPPKMSLAGMVSRIKELIK